MNNLIFSGPASLPYHKTDRPPYGQLLLVKFSAFFVMLHLFIPPTSRSASFDCAKAKTTQEKLICGNAVLSKLDDSLAHLYSSYRAKAPNPEEVKKLQIAWLNDERSRCVTVKSLEAVLRERAAAIEKSITGLGPEDGIIRWKWVTEGGEELYPQLLNPLNERNVDAINRAIASDYRHSYNYSEEDCDPNEEFDYTVVTFASWGIFSCKRHSKSCSSVMASLLCRSFDVKTGTEIYMTKLFKNWETERANALNFIFKGVDDEHMKKGDTGCLIVPILLEYYKESEGYTEHTQILFFSDSVSFTPDFPRGFIGCAETVTLPCKKLIPFAAPNSVLMRFK